MQTTELKGGFVIRAATLDDVRELTEKLRHMDVAEIQAARGEHADIAHIVRVSYLCSLAVMAVEWRGVLLGLAGVSSTNALSRDGIPWALCTSAMDTVRKRGVVVVGAVCLQAMREVCSGKLSNFVDVHNTKSQLWLRWMGFGIDDKPVPYGICGAPFYRFSMEAA